MTNRDRQRRHPHSSSAHHRSAHSHSSSSGHSRSRRSHHSSGRSAHHLQRQHIRIHHDDDFSFINPCVKYSLFFFNLIFWLLGAGLAGLGTWSLLQEYNENATWVNVQTIFDVVLHISLTLILIGSIVFCMSFAGCLGALRENLCLLKLYSLKLLFLFIGEIILSTVAFMFPNSFLNYLKDNLSKDPIQNYRNDSNLRNLIDVIQMEFKCCGISDKGYKDWSGNVYFNCNSTNRSSESCAVPYSCCRNQRDIDSGLINIMCGYNVQNISSVVEVNKYIYTRGCIEAMTEFFERNMNIVVVFCLVSAVIQLFAMFLARSLQGQIMAQRARWM